MASIDKAEVVVNQHYDESVDVNDSEEVASMYSQSPAKTPTPLFNASIEQERNTTSMTNAAETPNHYDIEPMSTENLSKTFKEDVRRSEESTVSDGESSEEGDTSSDDEENAVAFEGAYDPEDYDELNVSQEIKELFQYITRYTPQTIQLEHKLKPFIPEYIPAVGDIDAFIKVPNPDNQIGFLGLSILDEPCAKQSDPTVFDLQLRSISKMSGMKEMQVRSLDNVQNNPKALAAWMTNIEGLHKTRPPQNVHFSKSMPDIEQLMQEWPAAFEEILSQVSLPSAEMNCTLHKYIDTICSVLDIPVYNGNRIMSLHVLFSLYMEFKNSQHFQTSGAEQQENQPDVLTFD